jgi:zinc protease
MSTFLKRTTILLAVFLISAAAFAAGVQEVEGALDAPTTLLPFDDEITYGRLANGITYYIRENSQPRNRASLRLIVDAGSVLETDEQQGLAHFAEHMAFNGTEDFEGNEIISFMESLGMRFGPDLNAYTSFDETVYILEVPTDDEEKMESGFHVLEQWATSISFDPEEVDAERGVILEEWRVGRGASARMRDQHLPVIFRGSRYAERLPIGKPEIIRTFEREVLVDFYETWYRPELMSIIAVGDFDTAEVSRLIHKYFESVEPHPRSKERPYYTVPEHEETLVSVATDPEATQTRVSVYIKHAPEPFNTIADYRRSVVRTLYSIMLNNRLSEIARDPDAPFLQAGIGRTRIVRGAEVNVLTALTEPEGISRGLDAVIREALRTREHGFARSEFERAKRELETSYRQAYEERSKSRHGSYAREYGRLFLEDEASPGIEFEYDLVTAMLPRIALEEVQTVAEDYLGEENRVVTVSAPKTDEAVVPDEEEILDVLEGARLANLEPYETTVTDEPLMSELPEPGRIVEETEHEDIDVTEWRLSNGARVVVKPTDFKNDEILFGAFSPGGTSLASDGNFRSASQAASIVSDAGIAGFSAAELDKLLAGRTVSMTPYIGELTEGLDGSASRRDLETMFQLAHLYFTEPRQDEQAFRAFMRRLRTRIENRRAQPENVFFDRLRSVLASGHERRQPLTVDKLEEISLEAAYEFYTERFGDASDFTFFIVGSAEPSLVRPFVERYLASLPSEGRKESWKDVGIERPDGVVSETVEKGIEERSRVSLVFHGPYEWSREENHILRSTARALETRLREVIREEEGGTYGIGVWASPSRYPEPEYLVHVTFGTDPARADDLSRRVLSVIDSIAQNGFDQSYAQRVRTTQTEEFEKDIRTNDYWMSTLQGLYFHELEPNRILEYPELIERIDAELITNAARRYLDTETYIELILFPEETESQQQQ